MHEAVELQEFVHVEWICGYGSVMYDGNTYAIDLCQQCVKEVLAPFARVIQTTA